jgi:drug/metabolite transporter (DMT)-like permease
VRAARPDCGVGKGGDGDLVFGGEEEELAAVLALFCHLFFEETAWSVGLGLGPVGLAFYTWDFGVKRGDVRALGAFSYAAPLLSTLLLIAFGRVPGSWYAILACVLIVGGAALAAVDSLRS